MTKFWPVLLLILAGCSTGRLASWQGREFTVCCDGNCHKNGIAEKVRATCPGVAALVGGSNSEKTAGYYFVSGVAVPYQDTDACETYRCDLDLKLR